jgi:hypothetical protein
VQDVEGGKAMEVEGKDRIKKEEGEEGEDGDDDHFIEGVLLLSVAEGEALRYAIHRRQTHLNFKYHTFAISTIEGVLLTEFPQKQRLERNQKWKKLLSCCRFFNAETKFSAADVRSLLSGIGYLDPELRNHFFVQNSSLRLSKVPRSVVTRWICTESFESFDDMYRTVRTFVNFILEKFSSQVSSFSPLGGSSRRLRRQGSLGGGRAPSSPSLGELQDGTGISKKSRDPPTPPQIPKISTRRQTAIQQEETSKQVGMVLQHIFHKLINMEAKNIPKAKLIKLLEEGGASEEFKIEFQGFLALLAPGEGVPYADFISIISSIMCS